MSVEFDSDSRRQVHETQRRPSSVKWEGPAGGKKLKRERWGHTRNGERVSKRGNARPGNRERTKVTIKMGHTNWVDRHASISSMLKRVKTQTQILNEFGTILIGLIDTPLSPHR